MAPQSGAQIVRDFLASNKIKYVFGNPGTTEKTFLAALAGAETEYILALHESSATGIAAGYALITNKAAVVNIQKGPLKGQNQCTANKDMRVKSVILSNIILL